MTCVDKLFSRFHVYVNLCMQIFCTALGKAAKVGKVDAVTLLLMRNAQPDLQDKVRSLV